MSPETKTRTKKRTKKRKILTESYFDFSLIFIVLFLIGFGLIMIYSTSSYEAALDFGDATYYLKKQLIATVLGLGVMAVTTFIPYEWYRKIADLLFLASLVLVLLVLSPLKYSANGATRWIKIGGLTLQPSEVVKVGIILLMASLICRVKREQLRKWKVLIVLVIPSVVAAAMIFFLTNNLSSAIIVLGIAVVMLFVASPEYSKFLMVFLAAAAVIAVGVLFIVNAANSPDGNFRVVRILAWLNPEAYADDTGFQTLQALYAIGSGSVFGKGLGQSMQKLGFLPEAQNDMIFSIICEELGLFGALAVIFMFGLLLWRLMVIAINARDRFGCLIVVGVMAHLSIQVILNIGVVTNTIPNTGISLPFISYGGSSALFLMAEMGMVCSVARKMRV